MISSKFERRRIELYIAGVSESLEEQQEPLRNSIHPVVCGALESRASIEKRHLSAYQNGLENGYKTYVRQAQALFAEVAPRSCFSVFAEDSRERFQSPTIVKSRLIKDRDAKGVLFPIDRKHHWNAILELPNADQPFEKKDNKLVWRGVTTGTFQKKSALDEYSSRYHVASLTVLNDGIDIKYTSIVQIDDNTSDIPIAAIKSRTGNKMSISQQLSSKFILCLEGNDVATGLKWMMASNSTVVMPVPTCETWFCEGELQPWVHYVPVKDDLTDINDIYEWCLANQKHCKEIAFNGKRFVSQFLDKDTEKKIIKEVIYCYLKNSDENLDFGIDERLKQYYNYITLLVKAKKFSKSTVKWSKSI